MSITKLICLGWDKIRDYVENQDVPFVQYLITFLAVVTLRNFLDIFADTAVVSFSLLSFNNVLHLSASAGIFISMAHLYLFWIALMLTLGMVYSWVTKEKPANTLRTIFSFSWIILLTPIIDLIISSGKGIEQQYVIPQHLLELFPLPAILDPGEKTTITVSLVFTFLYCAAKTQKLLFGFWGVILAYFCNLLSLIPTYLIVVASRFANAPGLKTAPVIVVIRVLAIYIFCLLLAAMRMQSKERFRMIVKETGLLNILHFVLLFGFGVFIAARNAEIVILANLGSFLLTIISLTLGWISLVMLKKSEKTVAFYALATCLLFSLAVNAATLFLIIAGLSLGYIYNFLPIKLKRVAFFSKAALAGMLLLVFMLGWLFTGRGILHFPPILMLYFLVFYSASLNVLDLEDSSPVMAAEKGKGIADIYGEKKARILAGLFIFASYLACPLLFLEKRLIIPCALIGLLQFSLINLKRKNKLIFLVYLLTLIGLIIWRRIF